MTLKKNVLVILLIGFAFGNTAIAKTNPEPNPPPNLPPGYEYIIEDWAKDGFFFVKDQYFDDNIYIAIFQQPWIYNPMPFGKPGNDCAVCPADAGVVMLEKQKNGEWKAVNMTQGFFPAGGFGVLEAKDVSILKFAQDNYGVLLKLYAANGLDFLNAMVGIGFINHFHWRTVSLITHYDNFDIASKENQYAVDISISPQWNNQTNSTDLILHLSETGERSIARDARYAPGVMDIFGSKKELRMIYEEGRYIYADEP